MPPRKLQPKPAQKHELEAFAEKYDLLAVLYGDPVEVVFGVMARAVKSGNDELAHNTADTLMGYRYPKVKAQEVLGDPNNAPVTQINVQLVNAPTLELRPTLRPPTIELPKEIGDPIGGS